MCIIGLHIYTYFSTLNFLYTCLYAVSLFIYLFIYLSGVLKYSVCLAMYEETDVLERILYHGRNWSFLRPVFCPQFYNENGRFLADLEINYLRSACSLSEKNFLCLSITSSSCISDVKERLRPFLNPT